MGDATITYKDPHAAMAAVEWFHNNDFHGAPIEVHIAESKTKDMNDHSYAQQNGFEANSRMVPGVHDDVDRGGGRGRGRGDASGQSWQKDGDWMCPNTKVFGMTMVSHLFLHHEILILS